jgi:polar amino acid transport system substrate-binding protein
MHSISLRFLSFSFLFLFSSSVFADTLRIGTWDRESKGSLAMTSEAILTQAYAELNQPIEFIELPVRRALEMLLKGQLDGNFYRVAEIAQQYPMLFRVDTPLNNVEIRVYRNNTKINPENWAQIQALKVGYLRGALMIERQLGSVIKRVEGDTQDDVFKLLSRGVVDVVLVVEPTQSAPASSALAAKLERLDVVLDSVPLYHYLSERHRDVGIRLNTVLKRMQSSGELQKIRQRVLKDLN